MADQPAAQKGKKVTAEEHDDEGSYSDYSSNNSRSFSGEDNPGSYASPRSQGSRSPVDGSQGEGSYDSRSYGSRSYDSRSRGDGSYDSRSGGSRSFEGSQGSFSARGDGSHHGSVNSYESGSIKSGADSFGDIKDGSHHGSGNGSYESGSIKSGADSFSSHRESVYSGDGSVRSGSFRSGDGSGSYRSHSSEAELQTEVEPVISGVDGAVASNGKEQGSIGSVGSYASGDGRPMEEEGSVRSGEGSYQSGSIYSGDGSVRSGSFRSGDGSGSYRSHSSEAELQTEVAPVISGVDGAVASNGKEQGSIGSVGSYASGDGRPMEEEGSVRSGEGSYQSGSIYSGDGSVRSGSFRSGDGSGSYRSHSSGAELQTEVAPVISGVDGAVASNGKEQGSIGSVGSYASGDGRPMEEEGSVRSGEGSYQSGSIYSGDGSVRSGSFRSGDGSGSYRSHSSGAELPAKAAGSHHGSLNGSGNGRSIGSYESGSIKSGADSFGDIKGGSQNGSGNDGSIRSYESGSIKSGADSFGDRKDGSHNGSEDESGSFKSGADSFEDRKEGSHHGSVGSYESGSIKSGAGSHHQRSPGASYSSHGSQSFHSQESFEREGQNDNHEGSSSRPKSPGDDKSYESAPKDGSLEFSSAFEASQASLEKEADAEKSLSLSQAFSQRSGSSEGDSASDYSNSQDHSQSHSGSYSSRHSSDYEEGDSYRSGSYGSASYRSEDYQSGSGRSRSSGSQASQRSGGSKSDSKPASFDGSSSLRDGNETRNDSVSESSNYDSFANDSNLQFSAQQMPTSMLSQHGMGDDPVDQNEAKSKLLQRAIPEEGGAGAENSFHDHVSAASPRTAGSDSQSSGYSSRSDDMVDSFAQDSNLGEASQASFLSSAGGMSFADDTSNADLLNKQAQESFLGKAEDSGAFASFAEASGASANFGESRPDDPGSFSNRSDEHSDGSISRRSMDSEEINSNEGGEGSAASLSGHDDVDDTPGDADSYGTHEDSIANEEGGEVASVDDASYSDRSDGTPLSDHSNLSDHEQDGDSYSEGSGGVRSTGSGSKESLNSLNAEDDVAPTNEVDRSPANSPGGLDDSSQDAEREHTNDETQVASGDNSAGLEMDDALGDGGSLNSAGSLDDELFDSADDLDASGLGSFESQFSDHGGEDDLSLELDEAGPFEIEGIGLAGSASHGDNDVQVSASVARTTKASAKSVDTKVENVENLESGKESAGIDTEPPLKDPDYSDGGGSEEEHVSVADDDDVSSAHDSLGPSDGEHSGSGGSVDSQERSLSPVSGGSRADEVQSPVSLASSGDLEESIGGAGNEDNMRSPRSVGSDGTGSQFSGQSLEDDYDKNMGAAEDDDASADSSMNGSNGAGSEYSEGSNYSNDDNENSFPPASVNDSFPSLVSHSVADEDSFVSRNDKAGSDGPSASQGEENNRSKGILGGDDQNDIDSDEDGSLTASAVFRAESEEEGSEHDGNASNQDEDSLSASEIFDASNSGSYSDEGSEGASVYSDEGSQGASVYSDEGSQGASVYSDEYDDAEGGGSQTGEVDADGSYTSDVDADGDGSIDGGSYGASNDGKEMYGSGEIEDENSGGSKGEDLSQGSYVDEEASYASSGEGGGSHASNDHDASYPDEMDGSGSLADDVDNEGSYADGIDDGGSHLDDIDEEGSFVEDEDAGSYDSHAEDDGSYVSNEGSLSYGEEGSVISGEGGSYSSHTGDQGSYDGTMEEDGSYVSQEEGEYSEYSEDEEGDVSGEDLNYPDISELDSIMEAPDEDEEESSADFDDEASIDIENDEGSLYSDEGSYSDEDSRHITEDSLGDGSAFFPDASIDGTVASSAIQAAKDRNNQLGGITEGSEDGSAHGEDQQLEDPDHKKKKKKKKKKKPKKKKNRPKVNVRSEALLDLVENLNDAMLELEEEENRSDYDGDADMDSSARRLLLGFESLLGILLQLSDELELVSTFATKKDNIAIDALQAVLSFAPELNHVFTQLKPILQDYLYEEPDEEMDDLLYRLNSLMDLLVESTHRVGERHEWNPRAETAYVTLLEMLERDALEVSCLYDDVEVPEYPLSGHLEEAWTETGHEEEFKTLDVTDDIWMFRQVCYEVLVSTDQWCPDTRVLMDICGIDPADMDEDRIEPDDYELAPVPDAAKQVLEKVHGDPLPRKAVMASILRRILPPRAITDKSLLENFASIRNTIRNPRGLSATNLVAVSSVPELFSDPESLGVDGVGKTTLAAMVAHHADVRRFFLDGVIWIYIGQMELNYTRYTQCLRELLAQLYLEDDEQVPMFPDLIHTPGESRAKRRRREEGFMLHVRETLADFLQYRDVLIILDDICYEADLDWFDFAPIQSENPGEEFTFALLVTTRCRYLLPAADTVEIDMLDEADAIQLLIQESGENLSQTLMAESPEARSVVRECANHPLAVKSVGRWLNLKHATAGVVSSVEEIHDDVVKSMDKILKNGDQQDADMMYEILNMSLSPAINGEPTNIIKFCFSAFVVVFCDRDHISEFALIEDFPMVPMPMAELFFESLLELEENTLLKEGSLFYAQKKEAAVLIPEALSALGVLKVIATYSEPPEDETGAEAEQAGEEKYLQVMHSIQQEYGESLCRDDVSLRELTKDAERRWNGAFAEAFLAVERDWDSEFPDAALDYSLEMLPSHMIRGGMDVQAAELLSHSGFVRGRLFLLGRENATRRHIKDCENLFNSLPESRTRSKKKRDRKAIMKDCYETLGRQLDMDEDENGPEDNRVKGVEVGRAHYDIGFSLADKKCWDAAIAHWEKSQELLVSSIGMVEIVAAILFNVGVVYAEMSDYERSLGSLKQCLRIRGALHGEEHLLYAQTIQKIGDVFLMMSDYHEAMESYNWALDVMHIEPSLHRVDIGDIQENLGNIHYSKGEIDESLLCFQEALKSKQADLGEEHPELATIFHHIGNCLADQDSRFEAIDHFEQAIQLKEIDPDGGPDRDADVLTIEGVLSSISGRQEEGLECYEKALNILVTKVPHQKEKVASLLHLIGCMYLMFGQHKKAMKLFEESLQARRKVLGYVHLDVASTLYNMAFLHQNRGRLDKALKCLEEALKIRKLRLPESEKVAITYEKIGKFAREMGKTTKAQNALEEALQIRKKVHGGTHEAVASVLQELGDLMDDNANYKDAMDKYFEALDIRQNLFGNDHVAVAETFYSMGYTLQNQDSLDQALDCFEESLNIRKVQLGLDAKEVGDTLNMMGFLQAKRGELDDALSLLWDALRIRKLQEDHVKVSETLKNIGNVHREKQEHELAIECYEECLRIRRSELGDVHEKVADALIAMGNVQSDMELADEAMRSYREALTIRTYFFGEHDDSVGAVLQKMGSLEFQNGEYEKALSMLTEFIRIRQENDSENDGDYVNVLFMIGNIHKMQGNEEEAKKWWTDAYDVFQELGLSEGNPQVAQVMDNLLKQENIGQREEYNHKSHGFFGGITDMVKDTISDLGKLRPKSAGQRL